MQAERQLKRRDKMALASGADHPIPDCFTLFPAMFLQPASTTPEATNSPSSLNLALKIEK